MITYMLGEANIIPTNHTTITAKCAFRSVRYFVDFTAKTTPRNRSIDIKTRIYILTYALKYINVFANLHKSLGK